jgi:hypothetical protein
VTFPSFKNVAVMVLPSATLDQTPFVSSNHASFQVLLVRVAGGADGIAATVRAGAAVAASDAGVCAGWLVQPVTRTARTSRPMQVIYETFIVKEEFV